ncbi:MAG TPA: TolC family outer membrane protein, partial [Pseudolabrys sp.]
MSVRLFTRLDDVAVAAICMLAVLYGREARAVTLDAALVEAYQGNPTLNSQRASTRATDENVPQALSGYRPRVSITVNGGEQSLSSTTRLTGTTGLVSPNAPATYFTQSGYNAPFSAGATITQTLFNGFQTASRTRQAEAQVLAARATLYNTEQTVLLSAVTAYMNVLLDGAILDLQRRNVEVLQEQLRQTRDRFNVGEVTRTDVAQAESSLAAGRSQVLSAEATYTAAVATYRQVIGSNPVNLAPGTPVDRLSPPTQDQSVALAITTHPAVAAAQYNVDVAQQQVKVAESALYPNVTLQGSFVQGLSAVGSLNTEHSYAASVLGTLTVPIYQGGAEYSAIRQAKELLGQTRLNLDVTRDQTRQ